MNLSNWTLRTHLKRPGIDVQIETNGDSLTSCWDIHARRVARVMLGVGSWVVESITVEVINNTRGD